MNWESYWMRLTEMEGMFEILRRFRLNTPTSEATISSSASARTVLGRDFFWVSYCKPIGVVYLISRKQLDPNLRSKIGRLRSMKRGAALEPLRVHAL